MLYNKYLKNKKGYIALISVLVISAVALSIAISTLLLGVGSIKTAFSLEQSSQAQALADSCLEVALQKISQGMASNKSMEINEEFGSCSSFIFSENGNVYLINARGETDGVVKKIQARVKIISPGNTNFISWQEVADF